jgi:alpha-mannosidase
VHRPVKVGVHKAEQKLAQAEAIRQRDPKPEADAVERMKEAWRWVCFGHFHDTFGGTCIPSAYDQVHAQLGLSYAVADEMIQHGVRRIMNTLPDDERQRLTLFNASDKPFDGYAVHEPWLEAEHWQPHWRLIDEKGQVVPHQRMDAECLVPDDYLFFLRLVFRLQAKPGEMRVLRIDKEGKPAAAAPRVQASADRLTAEGGASVSVAGEGELRFESGAALPLPRLEMIEDPTDTWTHEIDRYADAVFAKPEWTQTKVIDNGLLMASIQQKGRIGQSELMAEYRVYAGEPFVEWLLRVYWNERHKLLKLTVPMPSPLRQRHDGIAGGDLVRPPDVKERPVRDYTLLEMADGRKMGLVFPDAYALDATVEKVRLTLLRSPRMAHHFPYAGPGHRALYADQGMHEFRFRYYGGAKVTVEQLDQSALMLQRPLITADLTRGMPPMELTPYIATNTAT